MYLAETAGNIIKQTLILCVVSVVSLTQLFNFGGNYDAPGSVSSFKA